MKKKYPEKLKIFEEVKNTEFKEEEPEEPKKYYNYFDENDINKFTNTKYDPKGFDKEGINKEGFDKEGLHKDTKNKYDPNGFDIYGKHKDTNTFLNKEKNIRKDILENINWLNDKDGFLKLYEKIIKNEEFKVNTEKNNYISSNLFKDFLEDILRGNMKKKMMH